MAKVLVFVFALFFIFSPTQVFAQTSSADPNLELTETSPSCPVCEGAESPSFAKSAPGKIGRGAVNILLGWTNLFAQPIQSSKSGGNIFSGIGNGFGYTLVRTLQGVVELGLFWLPPAYGEPLTHCALGDLGITGR